MSTDELRACKIGGKVFEYAKLTQARCIWGIWGLHRGSGSKTHIEIPKELNEEVLEKARSQRLDIDNRMRGAGTYIFGIYCGRCVTKCPAPIRKYGGRD